MIQNIQVKGLVKRVSTDSAGKHNLSPFLKLSSCSCSVYKHRPSSFRPQTLNYSLLFVNVQVTLMSGL